MALPTFAQVVDTLATPTHLQPGAQCPICLEPYCDDHRPVILHGQHIFCEPCIRVWLSHNNECPYCRRVVLNRPEARATPPVLTDETYLTWLTGTNAEFYQEALRSEHDLIPHYLGVYISTLRRRVQHYTAHRLDMNVIYRFEHLAGQAEEGAPEYDVDRPMQVDSLIFCLWTMYYQHLSRRPAPAQGFSVFQHPLAAAMMLETFAALKGWRGSVKSPEMLRLNLQMRWSAWERREYPEVTFARPDGWAEFKRSVAGCAASIHAGERAAEEMGEFKGMATAHSMLSENE